MKHRGRLVILPIALACCSIAYQCAYADKVPLPLGKLINTHQVTCPPGAAPGAVCTYAVVTGCKDANGNPLQDLGVTMAVTQPQLSPGQKPRGTIVLQSGGPGASFYDGLGGCLDATQCVNGVPTTDTQGFSAYFVKQGFTTVDLKWDGGPNGAATGPGWQLGNQGVLHFACRPATVFNEIYKNPQAHVKGTPYCGMGSSGGSAALGYALAYYGNTVPHHEHQTQEALFDFVNLTNGPATARIDVLCAPKQAYNNQPITNCGVTSYANPSLVPPGVTAPVYTFPPGVGPFNSWEGTTTCNTGNASQADINTWARDGNVSTGPLAYQAVWEYPHTNVAFYFCGSPINNVSLAMGWFLTQKIQPLNGSNGGLASVNCFTQCTNEAIYKDPNAVAQTESDMLKYCVLNHDVDEGEGEGQDH